MELIPSQGASSRPKVCVALMTYNHAPYIRQALDSVLAQKTDFEVRVLIHDDASDDGTREIIENYAAVHSARVETILQTRNQISQGRRIFPLIWHKLRGDYIALIEGDDCWIDQRKLSVQAKFLDKNRDCAICQTRSLHINDSDGHIIRSFPSKERSGRKYELSDLACGNFIQTSAAMFRSSALRQLPADFDSLPFGDYALFALIARSGWIGLIDSEMVLYRIHEGNFWANRTLNERVDKTNRVRAFIALQLLPADRGPWLKPLAAPTRFWGRQRRRLQSVPRRIGLLFGMSLG